MLKILVLILFFPTLALCFRAKTVISRHRRRVGKPALITPLQKCPTLISVGQGGHKREMFEMLKSCALNAMSPTYYVYSDSFSPRKILEFENSFTNERKVGRDFYMYKTRSPRIVGDKYRKAIINTFICLIQHVAILAKTKPRLILCNGPGLCVALCYAALALEMIGLLNCRIIFIESLTRTENISLTGKLLYPIADRVLVHWSRLLKLYPRAEISGISLCSINEN